MKTSEVTSQNEARLQELREAQDVSEEAGKHKYKEEN